MTIRKVAAAIALILFTLAVITIGLTGFAHGATTSKKSNAFGAVTPTIDPNVSMVAAILSVEQHRDRDGRVGLNFRLHPLYSYSLFDESLMFCGDVVPMFEGKVATFQAFTYRRAASRLIDGIPCHELRGVNDVVTKTGIQ